MDNLRKLPQGAAYTQKQGQATVSAAVQGDSLIITATCDSLQYLVYQYEKEITRLQSALEVIEKEKEPCPSPLKWFLYGLLGGGLGGGTAASVITFIIIRKCQKNNDQLA
jgi:hypothetical protein